MIIFIHYQSRLDWMIIRRVLIRARQQFSIQPPEINISQPDMKMVEVMIFIQEEKSFLVKYS